MKQVQVTIENIAVLANVTEVIVRALKLSGDRSIITSNDGVATTEEGLTKMAVDGLALRLKSKGEK